MGLSSRFLKPMSKVIWAHSSKKTVDTCQALCDRVLFFRVHEFTQARLPKYALSPTREHVTPHFHFCSPTTPPYSSAKMPHYGAKDLTVRLSKVDLQQSTPQPARNNQAKEACSLNHGAIAMAFNEGDKNGVLAETPLHIGDDELALSIIDSQENAPFAVILAGEASDAPSESSALCLSVFLSSQTFKTSTPKQLGVAKDLKIDIFLDGVLCGSTFVSRRFCTETRSGTEKHKRPEHTLCFAGRRIGMFASFQASFALYT